MNVDEGMVVDVCEEALRRWCPFFWPWPNQSPSVTGRRIDCVGWGCCGGELADVGPERFAEEEKVDDVLGGMALGDGKELAADADSMAPAVLFFSGVLDENMHAIGCPFKQPESLVTERTEWGDLSLRISDSGPAVDGFTGRAQVTPGVTRSNHCK
jgi:hypothetical protein